MAVQIFPRLNPIQAVEKSGVSVHKYKTKPNQSPGRINPAHGLFILLRNTCKIKVPINSKIIITKVAHIRIEKNARDINIPFTPFPNVLIIQ